MHVIVLMSTYNGEKYLREQIESLLSQTVPVDILVRDDGSSDSTVKILEEYASKKQLNWYCGKNLGPGRSFFDLVQKAPLADYYAFADQDDIWCADKTEAAINKLEILPCDIPNLYFGAFSPVRMDLSPIIKNEKMLQFRPKPSFGNALVENIAPGCTYVFNRKALEIFRLYKMEYITIHDWDLYRIVMALDGNVIYDIIPHIMYRQHGNNAIGFQSRTLTNLYLRAKRFLKKNRNLRYVSACHINACYHDMMPEQNKRVISLIVKYKDSIIDRLRFVFSHDLVMSHQVDSIMLSIMALVKMI